MFKKVLTAAAIATVVAVGAVGTTTAPAQAGAKVHFHVGGFGPYWGGGYHDYGYYGNPCRKWKRKFHRTGRYRFLRKYRRCMRYHY